MLKALATDVICLPSETVFSFCALGEARKARAESRAFPSASFSLVAR